jgi:5-methylcytosine-specific restriction endonuclease McrA
MDKFKRYQTGLTVQQLFPQKDKSKCACGCGEKLTGKRKRWATAKCNQKAVSHFFVIKGDVKHIRKELFKVDFGGCRNCGEITEDWEADHIKPIHKGGGGYGIENFQTLCKECHAEKSYIENQRRQKIEKPL